MMEWFNNNNIAGAATQYVEESNANVSNNNFHSHKP